MYAVSFTVGKDSTIPITMIKTLDVKETLRLLRDPMMRLQNPSQFIALNRHLANLMGKR